MSFAIVYRVEHKTKSTGPYTTNTSELPNNIANVIDLVRLAGTQHPSISPTSDYRDLPRYADMSVAMDVWMNLRQVELENEILFGFSSLEDLGDWFPRGIRLALRNHFDIVVYQVDIKKDRFFCEFRKQTTFTRGKAIPVDIVCLTTEEY